MKRVTITAAGFTVVVADPDGERELVITAVLQPGTPGSVRLWTVVDTAASLDGQIRTVRMSCSSDSNLLVYLTTTVADWVLGVGAGNRDYEPRLLLELRVFRQIMRRVARHYHLPMVADFLSRCRDVGGRQ